MRILGIDPGTYKMGVGAVDSEAGRPSLLYLGVLTPDRTKPLSERLYFLYTRLVEVIQKWEPSVMAVEHPFAGSNIRTAMAIGQAQAVAMIAGAHLGLSVFSYSPREVKLAVTDYGGSSKEQVQEMVKVLLELAQPPEPLDASDALAVAICHINASRIDDLIVLE